ncbi:MAG: nodulation protein NfeD, partial [Candidatus Methylomirabilales bacterium]
MKQMRVFALLVLLSTLFIPRGWVGSDEIYLARVDGIIAPSTAEFIVSAIRKAENVGAQVIVIELDTPGGLDLSMRDIIKEVLRSPVPVVVYVSPSGARAASAGAFITIAAHVAAMAPGTNIGAAHPVQMGGGEMDEEMAKKVENDAAAYIRGLAERRGRNAKWAEKAVRKSVSITAKEA